MSYQFSFDDFTGGAFSGYERDHAAPRTSQSRCNDDDGNNLVCATDMLMQHFKSIYVNATFQKKKTNEPRNCEYFSSCFAVFFFFFDVVFSEPVSFMDTFNKTSKYKQKLLRLMFCDSFFSISKAH